MRKAPIWVVAVAFISIFSTQISFAAITPGTKCSKLGATATSNAKKYTCVKSGKKLVWNKGVAIPTPTPTAAPTPTPSPLATFQGFINRCQRDPDVPAQWKELQEFTVKYGACSSPWRFVDSSSNYGAPQQSTTIATELLPISQCKLNDPGAYGRTFPRASDFISPTKSMNVLVIGASFPDYPEKMTPSEEYGKYFKFTQDFLKNISDVPVNPVYKVADHYIQLSMPINRYNLLEHQGNKEVFKNEMISKISGKFDFTGIDQILIVMPAQIPLTVADAAMSWNGKWNIDGKSFSSVYLEGPAYIGPREGNLWTFDPWITVHEQIGHQSGLGDHYGSEEISYNRPDGPIPKTPDDWGTGNWGNMSGALGDFIGWDKWTSGFLSDSQINCVPTNKTTYHWLRPSEIKNNVTKGAIIPLSGTTGIFIESHRNTGYNYKQDSKTNGALLYTIDVTRLEGNTNMRPFGYGLTVLKPAGRTTQSWANNMALGDATLKVGESITVSGFKITVVESGDFGDVIKVEKL